MFCSGLILHLAEKLYAEHFAPEKCIIGRLYRLSHSIKFLINKKSEQLTTELLNQYVLNSSLYCQAFHNWYVGHCSGKSEREMLSEVSCPGRHGIIQETK